MLEHVLNIVTTSGIFFIVAIGLLIVLTIMNVVNLAHGAFMTIGGYTAFVVSQRGGNQWLSLALAPLVGFGVGLITERLLIRRLYGRPLDTILATWGFAMVITQLIATQFGRGAQFVTDAIWQNPIALGNLYYSQYRLALLVVAILILAALVALTKFSSAGVIARAVIMNPDLARALGINTVRVNAITFAVGSAFAAFAGALIVPMSSVDPNMGTPWVITAFMVVLAGGPSVPAIFLGALLLAAAQVLSTYYLSPVAGNLAVIIIPMLIMRFMPDGLMTILPKRFE